MRQTISRQWQKLIDWLDRSLVEPDDTDSIRVRKITIGLLSLAIVAASLTWMLSFLTLELNQATNILDFIIVLMYAAGAIYLFRTRNFKVYVNFLALVALIFWSGLHFSLGGFLNAGLVIIMSLLLVLIGSLVLSRANTVLLGILAVIVFGILLFFDQNIRANPPDLPPYFAFFNGFFTFVTLVVFTTATVLYLVRQLEEAQNRADNLLYNLLPFEIAQRLKHKPGTIAEAHEAASILFADIVGFTPLTDKITPQQMVEILNEIYSHFDLLVERHGAEKIRTIGDAYMAAAGVPESRPDHAQALAHMALDMIAYSESLAPVDGTRLRFRIGINSGSLVAGVIGSDKLQYDIWGDAVNVASRMESHGLPGRIQVSRDTYELLKNEFDLEYRGRIGVKGKGEMDTWFLIGDRLG